MQKQCFKCSEVKPLHEFYRHPNMRDGHLNKCKGCAKRDVRKNRQESPRSREYDRERWRNNPDRRRRVVATSARWRAANPLRAAAHNAVARAKRKGLLTTPDKCEQCGKDCSNLPRQPHGHHEDYARPLDVTWLCARCHHAELRVSD